MVANDGCDGKLYMAKVGVVVVVMGKVMVT